MNTGSPVFYDGVQIKQTKCEDLLGKYVMYVESVEIWNFNNDGKIGNECRHAFDGWFAHYGIIICAYTRRLI